MQEAPIITMVADSPIAYRQGLRVVGDMLVEASDDLRDIIGFATESAIAGANFTVELITQCRLAIAGGNVSAGDTCYAAVSGCIDPSGTPEGVAFIALESGAAGDRIRTVPIGLIPHP